MCAFSSVSARVKLGSGAAVAVDDAVVEIAQIDEESRLALRAAALCRYWWLETGLLKAVGGKEAGIIGFSGVTLAVSLPADNPGFEGVSSHCEKN